MLDKLTHRDFERHLNTTFAVHYSDTDSFDALLIEVKTLGQKPEDSNQRWAYSLLFHIPEKESYLVQRIYRLSHPDMGDIDLFLVPLGPDETGMLYEAIFN